MDRYAQVDLEDVKREFAKLDVLGNGISTNLLRRAKLLQELAVLAPTDRESEWKLHIEGLLTIAKDSAELAIKAKSHRYFRVSRKAHTTAKEATRGAIAIVANDWPAPQDGTTSSFKPEATFPAPGG